MRRRTALLLPLLLPGQAAAQASPPLSRFGGAPIRLIVPFAPGGGADVTAHILAPPLTAALGRPVLVENRPGGRGIPGAESIARANPDGQTLGLTNTAPLGMAPLLEALPYDPDRDFTHVALIAETPSVLLVPADSRFQSMDLFLRAARSWARGLTYGSPATGSLQHLQGEMLAKAAGARLTHVAYRGTGPALQDLLNAQVDSLMAPLLEALPYDADRDFAHIALIAETPSVLLVPADSRFQSFDLYLRAARSWARGLTYGSPATGSLQHLQGEMLAKASGARLAHVAYRGTGPALQDLVNGQVDSLMAPLASVMGAITAGRARVLAVSGPAAEPSLPGVPTFAALGFPQLTATAWMGLSGPRGLAPALVERLNGEVNRIIALPEVAAQLRAAGLTPPDRPLDAAAYRQLVADFTTTWRPVVAAAGMAAK